MDLLLLSLCVHLSFGFEGISGAGGSQVVVMRGLGGGWGPMNNILSLFFHLEVKYYWLLGVCLLVGAPSIVELYLSHQHILLVYGMRCL